MTSEQRAKWSRVLVNCRDEYQRLKARKEAEECYLFSLEKDAESWLTFVSRYPLEKKTKLASVRDLPQLINME